MAAPYSQDLRDRVLRAYDRGMKTKQIAETFHVSPSWARRVKQRRRETGETTPRRMGSPGVTIVDRKQLASLVREHPDATLAELRTYLGVPCALSTLCQALKELGLSFKKTIHAAEQDRPDVVQRRSAWRAWTQATDARRLIFVDETWAKTNMTRLRGRAPRGQRLVDKTPHGHWKTTTLIAALGIQGMRCSTVVDGAVNGDVFEAFVAQVLVPQLKAGDIVIMDNLSSHKRAGIRERIEAVGAELLYLPPYSPDLNPIEMVFSKIKQLLRTLACRTRTALWQCMQTVLDAVTPSDAINCFRHAGYTLHVD
ncbi:MAG: IS630 family transposase [Planctomycetota bacterium]|nr:MAG: IS630 family transposase [Planctomycetota bacterium]